MKQVVSVTYLATVDERSFLFDFQYNIITHFLTF